MWLIMMLLVASAGTSKAGLPVQKRDAPDAQTSLVPYREPPGPIKRMFAVVASRCTALVHLVGAVLPLRGLASFAADLGVPGASAIIEILTPSTDEMGHDDFEDAYDDPSVPSVASEDSSAGHRRGRRSDPGLSPYRQEVLALIGAAYGEQECLLRLMCLSGKRISAVTGAATLTLLMSMASGNLPEALRAPYTALKDAVMYSNDCSQYECNASLYEDQDLDKVTRDDPM